MQTYPADYQKIPASYPHNQDWDWKKRKKTYENDDFCT